MHAPAKNTLQALLQSSRYFLLPSVAGNLVMATALTHGLQHFNWLILLSGCLFYTAGMWINDVCGSAHDAVYNKTRPIPQGKISRSTLAAYAAAAMLLALLLLPADKLPYGLALGACIIAYNMLAQSYWLAGCFLIATCRFLLLLLVANPLQPITLAGTNSYFYLVAAILYCYIFVLSALAKNDHLSPQRKKTVGLLLGSISLLDALWCLLAAQYPAALLCIGLFWLGKKLKVRS